MSDLMCWWTGRLASEERAIANAVSARLAMNRWMCSAWVQVRRVLCSNYHPAHPRALFLQPHLVSVLELV